MGDYVTILNFSDRKDGNCATIVRYISDSCSNSNICVYSISEYVQPCADCNYECLRPAERCPNYATIKEVMDRVMESDLVYYIVPNFCGFPCANYFAFNERTVGYFNLDRDLMKKFMSICKKFIVVSNSENEMFYNAMAQQSANPQILYMKTSKYGKRSIDGDMLDSDEAKADLDGFLH